jgi:general secretion pathway protein I
MSRRDRGPRGFTMMEVMIGLALLGLALTVLIKSAANNIFNAEQAHMLGVATDLARGKMYDIEEILLKDGLTDTDQSQTSAKCFDEEGWPSICYTYKVEEPRMPSFDELEQLSQAQAKGATEEAIAAGEVPGGFQNSALGSMLGMSGMMGGARDITAAQGGALIQGQYSMFQEILKVSVRKVTLDVTWKVLGRDRELKVVAFFTDPAAMDKTIIGLLSAFGGAAEPEPAGGGAPGGGRGTPGGGGRGGGAQR